MSVTIGESTNYYAALYIRLSKEDESEGPSQSVTNQKSLLEEFLERQHMTAYETYIDDGYSGTSFDRPEFNRMIQDIESRKVNIVITKDLSRLGRDYIMTGYYMEKYFPEHRVRYISLLDGIDTGIDTSANDITPFRAIMNDMYAKDISKKIKSVKRDKQRKGLFIGGKPVYGYKMSPTEKNRIVIDEEAAVTVRRIFDMGLAGMSCRSIASALNSDGIPCPSVYAGLTLGRKGPYTGLWSSERICEMLRNETYIGNMVQGRQIKISYKSKKCRKQSPEDWIVVPGTHEPLVDAKSFEKVGIMLSSRKSTRCRTYDFLLKGLIFCHECGYPLGVLNRKNAAGEDRLFFVCRTYQRFTKAGMCTCHSVKEQTVTDAVIKKIQEVCRQYLQREQLLPKALEAVQMADLQNHTVMEIEKVKGEIEKLTENLDKMYRDKLAGILEEADFIRLYKTAKSNRANSEKHLRELESKTASSVDTGDAAIILTEKFLSSVQNNREFLINLIERIELTKERKLILKFRFSRPESF